MPKTTDNLVSSTRRSTRAWKSVKTAASYFSVMEILLRGCLTGSTRLTTLRTNMSLPVRPGRPTSWRLVGKSFYFLGMISGPLRGIRNVGINQPGCPWHNNIASVTISSLWLRMLNIGYFPIKSQDFLLLYRLVNNIEKQLRVLQWEPFNWRWEVLQNRQNKFAEVEVRLFVANFDLQTGNSTQLLAFLRSLDFPVVFSAEI